MKTPFLGTSFEVKDFDASTGKVAGYISRYGEVDHAKDIVMPGAFKTSLKQYTESKRKMVMLWQHDQQQPIGVWDDLKDDGQGLYGEGTLARGVRQADEAHILASHKALSGISMGYRTRKRDFEGKGGARRLLDVDLIEASLVTFPCLDTARIDTVKSLPDVMTLRDCEEWLRDVAGLSINETKSFLSKVKAAHTQRDVEGDVGQVINRLSNLIDKL